MNDEQNKFEIRNPKQIPMTKAPNSKPGFGHWNFEF
jgi:hypothetical protein